MDIPCLTLSHNTCDKSWWSQKWPLFAWQKTEQTSGRGGWHPQSHHSQHVLPLLLGTTWSSHDGVSKWRQQYFHPGTWLNMHIVEISYTQHNIIQSWNVLPPWFVWSAVACLEFASSVEHNFEESSVPVCLHVFAWLFRNTWSTSIFVFSWKCGSYNTYRSCVAVIVSETQEQACSLLLFCAVC